MEVVWRLLEDKSDCVHQPLTSFQSPTVILYSCFFPPRSVNGRNASLIAYLAFDYAAYRVPVLPILLLLPILIFDGPLGELVFLK